MIIKPDNDKLVYSGRIDWSNTEAPKSDRSHVVL